MPLGPAGSSRPDVFSMARSFTRPNPLAYEIKVSVNDYRRDATRGKWQSYLDAACGVYFACPAGMLGKADVPRECGLMVRVEDGWKTLRAPVLHAVTMPIQVLLKLLMDGVERLRHEAHVRNNSAYLLALNNRKKLSQEVAEAVHDMERYRERIALARNELETLQVQVEKCRAEIRQASQASTMDRRLRVLVATHFDLENDFGLEELRAVLSREAVVSDASLLQTLRMIADLAGKHIKQARSE